MRRIFTAITALALAFSMLAQATSVSAANAYDSSYFGESAFLSLAPAAGGQFAVGFTNTGFTGWQAATSSQVNLAICAADKVTCNVASANAAWASGWLSATAYATQSTSYVGPGQIGWFVYSVTAPATAGGTTARFNGDLVLATTLAKIHAEGYYQDATVTAPAVLGIAVTPTAAATNTVSTATGANATRGNHTYVATLGSDVTGPVRVMLVKAANITANTDGTFTFAGTGTADQGTLDPSTQIISMNGIATTGTNLLATAGPDGKITFVVDSQNFDQIRPVVFKDTNADGALAISTTGAPTETAGVGGQKTWAFANATFGFHDCNGTSSLVTYVDKTAKFFLTAAGDRFNYDSNDIFRYTNFVSLSQGEFESYLSTGDDLAVSYDPNPAGISNFRFCIDKPAAPSGVTATTSDAPTSAGSPAVGMTDATITWTAPVNPCVNSYTVTRQKLQTDGTYAADTTAQFTTTTSPTPSVGSITTSSTTVYDLNVPAGTFRYKVTATSTGPNPAGTCGATSAAGTSNSLTSTNPNAGAPVSTAAYATTDLGFPGEVNSGETWRIIFNEPVTSGSLTDALIRVIDPQGDFTVVHCNGIAGAGETGAACSLNPGAVTIGTTPYAAGQILTVVLGTVVFTPATTGSNGRLDYPLTIQNATGPLDVDESLVWNVAGSPDKTIEVNTTAPPTAGAGPSFTPPTPTCPTPVGTGTGTVQPTCSGAVTTTTGSTVQLVQVSINGGAFGTAGVTSTGLGTSSATFTFTDPTGRGPGGLPVTYTFKATDSLGNATTSPTRTVTISNGAPPVISAACASPQGPPTGAGTNPQCNGSASDSDGTVTSILVSINGGAFGTSTGLLCTGCGTAAATFAFTDPTFRTGSTTYAFRATDNNGNTTDTATIPVAITGDTTPPLIITGVSLNPSFPSFLLVTYNESVNCRANVYPGNPGTAAAFSFLPTGSVTPLTGASAYSASSNSCFVGFGFANSTAEGGTLTYTQPAIATDRIVDASGNAAASQTGIMVADTTAPNLASIATTATSTAITLTFSEAVNCGTVQVTDFTVTYNGAAVTPVSLTGCSGTSATLNTGTAAVSGQNVVVTSPAGMFTDLQNTPNTAATRNVLVP